MDNPIDAFIREAHDIRLGSADKAEIRAILMRKLGLGSGVAGSFALQPVAVSCAR